MVGMGYGQVDDHGFAAFGEVLGAGAWGAVATKKYEPDADGFVPDLAKAPLEVAWKLRLRGAVGALVAALAARTDASAEDEDWDRCQRRLAGQVAVHEADDDPAVVAAATRVRKALLRGDGTAQTKLALDQEVEFGRMQLRIAAADPLAADVRRLGLKTTLDAIAKASDRLDAALGPVSSGAAPKATRWKQTRAALQDCVGSFNTVHGALDWVISRTPPGDERARLEALRAPLLALLARYAESATPPAPPQPPAPPTPTPA